MFRSFPHATGTICFREKWCYCYLRDGQKVIKWTQKVLDSSLLRELLFEILLKIINVSPLGYALWTLSRPLLGDPSFGGSRGFATCLKKVAKPLHRAKYELWRGTKKAPWGGSSIFELTLLGWCGGGAPPYFAQDKGTARETFISGVSRLITPRELRVTGT